jgi:hypothetical protein
MAAIGLDTLKFARKLKAAGVPEEQAEAQAEIMSEAFLFNLDALVTKDYLDARLGEQEARIDARFAEQDARFAEQDARMDARFIEQDARNDSRFTAIDTRFNALDKRLAQMDIRFTEIDGKFRLVMWMLAVIMASTAIPAIHQLLS